MKKMIYESGLLDSRVYDDVCLLGKILATMKRYKDLTGDEEKIILNHFKKEVTNEQSKANN